jgi:hypothetical protein
VLAKKTPRNTLNGYSRESGNLFLSEAYWIFGSALRYGRNDDFRFDGRVGAAC